MFTRLVVVVAALALTACGGGEDQGTGGGSSTGGGSASTGGGTASTGGGTGSTGGGTAGTGGGTAGTGGGTASTGGGTGSTGGGTGSTGGGTAADTTPPVLIASSPTSGATAFPTGSGDGGTTLSFEFSEPINTGSFSVMLSPAVTLQAAVFSNGNANATVTTDAPLAASTMYTVTLAAQDVAGNALGAPTSFSFTTAAPPDTTPPTVVSTTPASNATNIALASPSLVVTFSEPMAPTTVVATTTAPFSWGTPVLSSGNTVATWSMPALEDGGVPAYLPSTEYTSTIEGTDVAGNPLAMPYSFSYTTVAPPDTTPPTLSAIAPVDQATSVPVNTYVVLQFSEAMNQASVESNLRFNGSAFSGTYTWSADGRTVRFARSTNFAATTAYDLSFAAAPTDLAGNALGSIARSFTTGGGVDGTAATVSSTVPTAGDDDYQPLSGCTFFRIRNGVVITFSSPVDRVSVTSAFAVLKGTTPVPGALSFSSDSRTLTFTPSATLDFNTTYTVRLNDGGLIAQDLYRNPIANLSYTFKTLRSITTNIFSTASGSGRILSAAVSGQSTVALNSSVRVGEFNNSTRSRGIYQFNVNLPAATTCVTGATLTIEQTGTNGSPYGGTSLGDVVAEVIDTEASVDATDYAKPKLTTGAGILDSTTVTVSTDATSGNKAAEVVGLVRALRAAPTPGNVRFRLRFTNDGASSGAVDYTQFQNSGARLQVRYEAP